MRVVATVFIAAALVAGRVEASRGLSESMKPKPKPEPSPMCETCEEFVTMGEAYLNDPATLNAITDKVNEVCETYAGTKHEAMVRAHNTSPSPPWSEPCALPTLSRARVISRSGRKRRNSPQTLHGDVTSSRSSRSPLDPVPVHSSPSGSLLEMYVQKAIDVINTDYPRRALRRREAVPRRRGPKGGGA